MITRRNVLSLASASAVGSLSLLPVTFANLRSARAELSRSEKIAAWMEAWMEGNRKLGAPLKISRFRDPMYFLIAPISWEPNLAHAGKYKSVEVPTGFVTDFASIPDVLFSVLRPDGDYAYAAAIHDYLYWTQERPRDEADEIFRLAMQDLQVDGVTITVMYRAVRTFGGSAWNGNARLKQSGEKRILIKFPDSPAINWNDWKKNGDVFSP